MKLRSRSFGQKAQMAPRDEHRCSARRDSSPRPSPERRKPLFLSGLQVLKGRAQLQVRCSLIAGSYFVSSAANSALFGGGVGAEGAGRLLRRSGALQTASSGISVQSSKQGGFSAIHPVARRADHEPGWKKSVDEGYFKAGCMSKWENGPAKSSYLVPILKQNR